MPKLNIHELVEAKITASLKTEKNDKKFWLSSLALYGLYNAIANVFKIK